MKNSVLITNSGINQDTGGGIVSFNLLKALESCTSVKYVFSSQKFPNNKYNNINAYSINPMEYGYTADPFSIDYLAYHLLPSEPVDIVQTYGCPFGLTVEELKRNPNCKVIADVAPHNIELSQEEHLKHCGQYPYPHLTDEMLWGLYSRNLRLADLVIVHSKTSAEYITKKARLQTLPTIISHGCNIPENIPNYPYKFIPGYFGDAGFDKGLYYLFYAWITICQKQLNRLYLGGHGMNVWEKNNELYIGGLHMPLDYKQYFNLIGPVPTPTDFYRQISIYIQSSITEGFGITPLEAMAHGRPVVVTSNTGVADLITDGKEGFIIPIRNIEAIMGRIQYFIDNPNEIQRMGTEARKTSEKYSWDRIREQYVTIYKNL